MAAFYCLPFLFLSCCLTINHNLLVRATTSKIPAVLIYTTQPYSLNFYLSSEFSYCCTDNWQFEFIWHPHSNVWFINLYLLRKQVMQSVCKVHAKCQGSKMLIVSFCPQHSMTLAVCCRNTRAAKHHCPISNLFPPLSACLFIFRRMLLLWCTLVHHKNITAS